MSDLMEKIRWLDRHERAAMRIGENGRRLAEQLTYEREIERSVPVISAAFRYFSGQTADAAPYRPRNVARRWDCARGRGGTH